MHSGPRTSHRFARPILACLPVILALALGVCSPVHAAWPTDPTVNVPLCTATYQQDTPTIVADGAGGAVVVWLDRRSGWYNIYAQRVSGSGVPQWPANGVPIRTAEEELTVPAVSSDGAGGAIVVWTDNRNGTADIFAQRVSAAGALLWAADGVAICTAIDVQFIPRIVPDNAGGAIICWWDKRPGYVGDIYAQRISSGGATQWAADGVAICAASGDQQAPFIVSDGSGGAIIAWKDFRSGQFLGNLYAQRVSGAGSAQWAANGVPLCATNLNQSEPTMVSDGTGGAVIAWEDVKSGTQKTYAQRISPGGVTQWAADGVAMCTGVGNEWTPAIASDDAGGAIVVWRDDRFWNVNGADLYAQRVSAAGATQWTTVGVQVCNNIYGDQTYPRIIPDGSSGAIVTWQDTRDFSYTGVDVYARKLTAAGATQWTFSGAAISKPTGDQSFPTIAPDGGGGAIIAWGDTRNGFSDIYAQRIKTDGLLGGSAVGVAGDVPRSFALEPSGPNPTRGGPLTMRFSLASDAAASIELFDVAGRRLAAREVDSFGAGSHTLDLGEGRRFAPGVYMVRLRQGANTRVARVSVLE